MAVLGAQLQVNMEEYVKRDELEEKLKNYVPREDVDASMKTVAVAVAKEKVDAAIAMDDTKNKITQIAESAVTQLMQQELQGIKDKIKEEVETKIQSFDEKLMQLLNEARGLRDSHQPTQDEKEKGEEKGDESDDEKSEDQKEIIKLRKKIDELKGQKGKENDKDNKEKEKRSITMRREFLYLPKYTGKHAEYDDWKFKIKTFLNEDIEYVELLTKLDDENEIPTETRAK